MNLYDFDGTIYDGDSSLDFYFFCLIRKPIIIKYLPKFILFYILYIFNIKNITEVKEQFFVFIKDIKNLDDYIDKFWKKKEKKIKKFYLNTEHSNDVIVSASPEFLLKNIIKKLGVKKLIASKFNKNTLKYEGINCSGIEKINRLSNTIKKNINNAYGNSKGDYYMLMNSKNKYLVKDNNIFKINSDREFKIYILFFKILNFFKLLFIPSCVFLGLLIYNNYENKYINYQIIASFISAIVVYFVIIRRLFKNNMNLKTFIISIIVASYYLKFMTKYSNQGIVYVLNLLSRMGIITKNSLVISSLCILSLFSMTLFIYLFLYYVIPLVKEEYKKTSKADKIFILVATIIGFIITSILYFKSSVFYNYYCKYDIIYRTDTSGLNCKHVFENIASGENDIRQPLFGLFSIPFSLIADFATNFFPFIPNCYYVLLNTIQIFLLMYTLVLIARMMNIKTNLKIFFYLIFLFSYSNFIYLFINEQYIISLFYLILGIYFGFYKRFKTNYFYIASVGTLITSGIIFPCISNIKKFKSFIINSLKCLLAFALSLTISTQWVLIFYTIKKFKDLWNFTGGSLKFIVRVRQYLYFVRYMFIAPKSIIDDVVYSLIDINFISVLGIIILLLCAVSTIINRKNKFAIISFLWIIFSFIITCVIGWGTKENALILYTLYFSWAYISLIYLFIDKLFKSINIKYLIYLLIIFIMIFFNTRAFFELLSFCFRLYNG